jgi:hypothetical protein
MNRHEELLLLRVRAMIDQALAHDISQPAPVAPMASPLKTRMTIREYAEHRDVGVSTVRRWIKRGLPHHQLGRKLIRVDVIKADAWLDNAGTRPILPPLILVEDPDKDKHE